MSLKIHTYPNNPRANKAKIAAAYNGVEIAEVPVEMGKSNKTPEFLKLNPWGKVPTLETPEGGIWESNAIARYAARLGDDAKLFGRNAFEAAQVEQWVDWVRGDLEQAGAVWLYPIMGFIPNNEKATALAKEDIANALKTLNDYLKTRTFLVGERITLADIVVSQTLLLFFKMVFDAPYRKKIPNVTRWFVTCVNQPNFLKVAGPVELCEKAQEAPAAAAPAAAAAAPAKEEPKEEKKAAAAPIKSTFDMGEWKRTYFNADNTRNTLDYFWKNFDSNAYSLWLSRYKYPEDNDVVFKTCNLLGGFIQRLEGHKAHQIGFASLCLFGDKDIDILGAWVLPGSELPSNVTDVPDYESYEFEKVDLNNEEDKKFLEDLFCWDGAFTRKGKTYSFNGQGKTLK